ncbi:MAG: ferritin family protein [Desulfuromonadales bacterium]
MNVFDFAMEMEDNGYVYYSNLARTATLPGLKTIFSSLAEDERKHFKMFRELKAGNDEWTMAETEALVTAKNVFTLLPRSEDLSEISGVLPQSQGGAAEDRRRGTPALQHP